MAPKLAVLLCLFLPLGGLAGCGPDPTPPLGRWEGSYESPETLVTARVEISRDGQIRLSAPHLTDISPDLSEPERENRRQNLAARLLADWPAVAPRKLAFDGETFRLPDGVAPQMVWTTSTNHMLLYLYLGKRPALKIPLRPAGSFSTDPFAPPKL